MLYCRRCATLRRGRFSPFGTTPNTVMEAPAFAEPTEEMFPNGSRSLTESPRRRKKDGDMTLRKRFPLSSSAEQDTPLIDTGKYLW